MPVIMYQSRSLDGLMVVDIEHVTTAEAEAMIADAKLGARPGLRRALDGVRLREIKFQAAATPAQTAIDGGAYVVCRWEGDNGNPLNPPCTIYGHIYTRDMLLAAERKAKTSLDALEEEPLNIPTGMAGIGVGGGVTSRDVDDSMAYADAAHKAGWRYGKWWSVNDLEGEPGEHHVAELTVITGAQFRAARAAGWPEEVPSEPAR